MLPVFGTIAAAATPSAGEAAAGGRGHHGGGAGGRTFGEPGSPDMGLSREAVAISWADLCRFFYALDGPFPGGNVAVWCG